MAYYALSRFVTFCWVDPVLLRPARFLIRTVTDVANFLTVLMLGLHYVLGGYGGHVCPKRSAPWDFSPYLLQFLLGLATFSNGLSRFAGRAVKGRRWSTPGGSKVRYGSARSAPDLLRMPVRCLAGRHGLMGFLAFFTF